MASAVLKFCRSLPKSTTLSTINTYSGRCIQGRQFYKQCSLYASTEILMPSLSPTMTEGTIIKWYKKEGEAVNAGDLLCDIQTDKAVVSLDTEEEGVLAKILKPDNSADIKVGVLIALMVDEGDDWKNVEIPASVDAAPPTPAESAIDVEMPTPEELADTSQMSGIGPSVRKLAEEYHISIPELKGSGPHNIITKGDVLKHIMSRNLAKLDLTTLLRKSPHPTHDMEIPEPQPPPPESFVSTLDEEAYTDIPNTGMRNTIAKRLSLSKATIPHTYMTIECNVGPVTKLRKKLAENSIKVSVNDFIIKSAAIALQRVPQVNSVWEGDEPQRLSNVDISVAVATSNGLITPIVKNAPFLGIDDISSAVRDLASRAKENKLQLHEFQGGTFTISNLGMYGISEFTAVINMPQTAIMAVGAASVMVGSDGKPESRMAATLSYDARVIDDSEASQFLEVFRDIMENPQFTIVGSALSQAVGAGI